MSQVWSLQEVLKYFQEDQKIKEVLTVQEFRTAVDLETEFLKVLRTALEYQGFDPKVIMRQLIRNRASYLALKKDEIMWDLANVSGDFQVTAETLEANKFSSNGPFAKDLELLFLMFLLRNNHISKIIKKSVEGIAAILEMLKEKYDINDETRKSGTALGSKDITLL